MIKPAVLSQKSVDGQIVRMCDMEPYDIGVILENDLRPDCAGELVMKTASNVSFEVFSLTEPTHSGSCWGRTPTLSVRLLTKGDTVTLEVE